MNWEDLARERLTSAEILLNAGRWRGVVSRAYDATYCAVVWRALLRGPITFATGYQNPSHEAIPGLIRNKCLPPGPAADNMVDACTLLRYFRIDADYKPHRSIDARAALDTLREAKAVLAALGLV